MNQFKYYCGKCDYGTDIKFSLLQHNETILHKTGERGKKNKKIKDIHKCEKCDYQSTNKNNYLTHSLNNHSTKEERENRFTYYCKYCDFGVFTESSINKHNTTIRHKRLSNIN